MSDVGSIFDLPQAFVPVGTGVADDANGNGYKLPSAKRGRPSVYKPEYAGIAFEACSRGATDHQLSEILGVPLRSIERWRVEKDDFRRATKIARAATDDFVVNAMLRKATGYQWEEQESHKVKDVEFDASGKKTREIERIEIVTVKRQIPPDTVACIFWLKNRQPQDWRDKREVDVRHDVTTVDSTDQIVDQVKQQLGDAIAQKLLTLLAEDGTVDDAMPLLELAAEPASGPAETE